MFKAITPRFIQTLDAWLLVNHPVIWMSKIHYAVWHGAALWVFSALLGAVIPLNIKQSIQYELWYFLLTVLGVVILCFWVYRYVIFNKEKNYGTRRLNDEYKNFILVFFAVGVFLLLPWPFEMVYNSRVAHMYTDEEVLKDIDVLNECDPYMAHSTNNYYSWYDSVTKVQYFNMRQLNPYGASYYTPYFMRLDSAKYPQVQTEFQLYRKYHPISDLALLEKKIAGYVSVAAKYDCVVNESISNLAQRYLALLKRDRIPSSEFYYYGSYQYELNQSLNNLCEAKFQTLFIYKTDYLWVMFYFIISITALLLLFKITYWQQYLITMVVLMLYPLVMFIFSQVIPYDLSFRRDGFFEISLLLLVIFSGITLIITSRNNSRFTPVYNIFNQVFYLTLLFSPLLLVAFLHDNTNVFHNKDGYYSDYIPAPEIVRYEQALRSEYYTYWLGEYSRWITIAKYAGIAGFIIALPLFKNLFVKQISLPEKN